MVRVHDTDGKEGSGYMKARQPQCVFAPGSGWEKCIILSPQQQNRVNTQAEQSAPQDSIVVPGRTRSGPQHHRNVSL
jgi:hypothetical protein